MILTIDVGGTFIKHALMNEKGNILAQGKVATPRNSQDSFLDTIDSIYTLYNYEIKGISISLPGTIDSNTGYVFQGGSLLYNHKCNLKQLLENRLCNVVEIENDARCATLAELWKGNLQGIHHGMVLTFGTGVGGCFVIEGKIHKGSHLFAGEVSMLIRQDIRSHGLHGVWGAQGSVVELIKKICEAKQVKVTDGPAVFQWIEQGDPIAKTIFEDYCYNIVTQLFNFQVSFDPQRICIGGGVSANPIFIQTIQSMMSSFYETLPIQIPPLEIMPCKFHNNSNLLGAFYHFKQKHM